MIAADIFVDRLVTIISEADVPPDSYAFLVDQNLGMIVHPNEAYAFDDVPLSVLDVREDEQILLLVTCIDTDTDRLVVAARRMREGESEDKLAIRR